MTLISLSVTLSIAETQQSSALLTMLCQYAEYRILFIIMLNAIMLCCYHTECLYAKCHYAECRYAEYHYSECRFAEFYYS